MVRYLIIFLLVSLQVQAAEHRFISGTLQESDFSTLWFAQSDLKIETNQDLVYAGFFYNERRKLVYGQYGLITEGLTVRMGAKVNSIGNNMYLANGGFTENVPGYADRLPWGGHARYRCNSFLSLEGNWFFNLNKIQDENSDYRSLKADLVVADKKEFGASMAFGALSLNQKNYGPFASGKFHIKKGKWLAMAKLSYDYLKNLHVRLWQRFHRINVSASIFQSAQASSVGPQLYQDYQEGFTSSLRYFRFLLRYSRLDARSSAITRLDLDYFSFYGEYRQKFARLGLKLTDSSMSLRPFLTVYKSFFTKQSDDYSASLGLEKAGIFGLGLFYSNSKSYYRRINPLFYAQSISVIKNRSNNWQIGSGFGVQTFLTFERFRFYIELMRLEGIVVANARIQLSYTF